MILEEINVQFIILKIKYLSKKKIKVRIMSARLYRVEYGFLAGRLCTLVYTSAALITMHSASETEALARVKQLVGDMPKRYGEGTEIIIRKIEPF